MKYVYIGIFLIIMSLCFKISDEVGKSDQRAACSKAIAIANGTTELDAAMKGACWN